MAKKDVKKKQAKSTEGTSDVQKLWVERIRRAKKKKEDEWQKPFRVALARDYFAGKQNPGYDPNEWITINKIYSQLMAELPSLYSVDPYFYVKTKRSYTPDPNQIAMFEQKAKIRQAYLNYLKGELNLKQKCRLGIQDAHFAFGVVKIHYYAEETANPDYGKVMRSETNKILKGDDGESLKEPKYIPINERYCLTRVHPDDFLFSDDSGPLEDKWPWLAEHVRMSKDEARNDPRLNKAVLKTIKPGEPDKDKPTTSYGEDRQKEDRVFHFWEVYDLKNKEWLIISEDADEPLKDAGELPKGVDCHPYSILRFTLQDNSAYPIPPVSQRIDPQKEYCLARSRYLTHRKRFNRKYEVFTGGLVDESQKDKLESGEDGAIIEKQTPNQVVTPILDAPLDQNGWTEIAAIGNDLNEISGYSGEARGLAQADSATQADILEKRLNIREGDRLSIVSDWILEIAEKLDKLVQSNISRDEAIRITGPQGEFWQQVKTSDYEEIDGDFEYSINVGATSPQLPQLERSQFLALLQLFANFPQILTNPHLVKRVMEMHNWDDEVVVQELVEMGQKMMSGAMPMPGQQGSTAGSPGQPGTAQAGSALGLLGGLLNGGGAKARDNLNA